MAEARQESKVYATKFRMIHMEPVRWDGEVWFWHPANWPSEMFRDCACDRKEDRC